MLCVCNTCQFVYSIRIRITMFIIDFDDTLFDTNRYKHARLDSVKQLGVSEEQYWESYRYARNAPNGEFTYSDYRHADMLALYGYDHDAILAALGKTSSEASLPTFLCRDTISFLEEIKAYGETMVLLSLGNPGYQELKTKGSGVSAYFDRTFMVHDTKQHILSELFQDVHSQQVFFINDKVGETRELHTAFPHMNVMLKISKNIDIEEYQKSSLPYFDSLTDIAAYVREHKT